MEKYFKFIRKKKRMQILSSVFCFYNCMADSHSFSWISTRANTMGKILCVQFKKFFSLCYDSVWIFIFRCLFAVAFVCNISFLVGVLEFIAWSRYSSIYAFQYALLISCKFVLFIVITCQQPLANLFWLFMSAFCLVL